MPLLSVSQLGVTYQAKAGRLRALDDVGFDVGAGEIVGIVGESGCGKSTLGAALLRLLPPNGSFAGGKIVLGGRDLLALSSEGMRDVRGREIAAIFQDPLTSLNPILTIGTQMVDAQLAHQRRPRETRRVLRQRAAEMLDHVGIPDASERLDRYPHEFSGGMLQRVMIGTALLLKPALLIADEPTSALDATLETQILLLLDQVRREHGTSVILISHDLGAIAHICDRVVVMYAGRMVEEGAVQEVFERPLHPYTRALLAAVPTRERRGEKLRPIPGRVPSLADLPVGCKFADRCGHVRSVCRAGEPRYVELADRKVRCAIYDPDSGFAA